MKSPIAIKLVMLAALGMGYVLLAACNHVDCADRPPGTVCAYDAHNQPTATCQAGTCKTIGTEPPEDKCGANDGLIGNPCTTPSGDTGKCVLDVPNKVIICGVGL